MDRIGSNRFRSWYCCHSHSASRITAGRPFSRSRKGNPRRHSHGDTHTVAFSIRCGCWNSRCRFDAAPKRVYKARIAPRIAPRLDRRLAPRLDRRMVRNRLTGTSVSVRSLCDYIKASLPAASEGRLARSSRLTRFASWSSRICCPRTCHWRTSKHLAGHTHSQEHADLRPPAPPRRRRKNPRGDSEFRRRPAPAPHLGQRLWTYALSLIFSIQASTGPLRRSFFFGSPEHRLIRCHDKNVRVLASPCGAGHRSTQRKHYVFRTWGTGENGKSALAIRREYCCLFVACSGCRSLGVNHISDSAKNPVIH